jgi:hypothetical protein
VIYKSHLLSDIVSLGPTAPQKHRCFRNLIYFLSLLHSLNLLLSYFSFLHPLPAPPSLNFLNPFFSILWHFTIGSFGVVLICYLLITYFATYLIRKTIRRAIRGGFENNELD